LSALNEGYPPGNWLFYVGIGYNTEKFREQGIPAPKSWADLWNPKLAGHIAIPALTNPQGVPFVVAASAVAGSPYDLSAGVNKISELKVYAVYMSAAQAQSDLSAGNTWAAVVPDGRVWPLVDAGKPVHFVLPEVPGMGKRGFASRNYVDIVRGTPNLELAKIYQQLASDATTQMAVSLGAGYSPTLPSAINGIVSKEPKWGERWPTPAELSKIGTVDWRRVLPLLQQTSDLFSRKVGR
jgi:spermidine/putrescine-binding protein